MRNVLDYRLDLAAAVDWRIRFGRRRQLDPHPSHPRNHLNRVAFLVRSKQKLDLVSCADLQMKGAECDATFGPPDLRDTKASYRDVERDRQLDENAVCQPRKGNHEQHFLHYWRDRRDHCRPETTRLVLSTMA